ncbi:transporter substrate-binding domain-containing protein [Kytococcus sedentarius]|uniref:transporter substrate-binding domain-containing protein n=1 Tax=Kytococcus sedentarius TaxID=1276 RepID=UPI0035BC3C5A
MRSWYPPVAGVLVALLLSGCSSIPADPDGTLAQIEQSGELTVGVAVHPPFTTVPDGHDEDPRGSDIELVRGFAERLGAEPTWVVGGEEELITQLEEGEIDLLVGGFTKKHPGLKTVGATRPYGTTEQGGKEVELVMAVVPGENALLTELEHYLDGVQ